jgi:hypothetical protein
MNIHAAGSVGIQGTDNYGLQLLETRTNQLTTLYRI